MDRAIKITAADPGLQVLLGQPVEVEAGHGRRRPSAAIGTVWKLSPVRSARSAASVLECSEEYALGLETPYTFSATDRVAGERGDQRRVDAAGQAEQHLRKPFLRHVVAQPHDQRGRRPLASSASRSAITGLIISDGGSPASLIMVRSIVIPLRPSRRDAPESFGGARRAARGRRPAAPRRTARRGPAPSPVPSTTIESPSKTSSSWPPTMLT